MFCKNGSLKKKNFNSATLIGFDFLCYYILLLWSLQGGTQLFCDEISNLMKTDEMKSKTFWLTLDIQQTTCLLPQHKFALPSFLLEDQLKQNIKVSKRALTRVHRCTDGVFNEYKFFCGPNVKLGNQLPGEKATTFKGKQQQTLNSALGD